MCDLDFEGQLSRSNDLYQFAKILDLSKDESDININCAP